jgi:hypothetical protein
MMHYRLPQQDAADHDKQDRCILVKLRRCAVPRLFCHKLFSLGDTNYCSVPCARESFRKPLTANASQHALATSSNAAFPVLCCCNASIPRKAVSGATTQQKITAISLRRRFGHISVTAPNYRSLAKRSQILARADPTFPCHTVSVGEAAAIYPRVQIQTLVRPHPVRRTPWWS